MAEPRDAFSAGIGWKRPNAPPAADPAGRGASSAARAQAPWALGIEQASPRTGRPPGTDREALRKQRPSPSVVDNRRHHSTTASLREAGRPPAAAARWNLGERISTPSAVPSQAERARSHCEGRIPTGLIPSPNATGSQRQPAPRGHAANNTAKLSCSHQAGHRCCWAGAHDQGRHGTRNRAARRASCSRTANRRLT